ncbi:cell division protein FtsX [bacterium BMS3Bbin06]|nr:cell division protein FtsX [bacterium BMS3Abin08]GBE35847.1 cell division protein FtsX [bacterium BMS3Bbin06]HDO36164.1 FtsX-like permease family protein [Nitrospirota bacterium]HDY72284.1 FtsX-like permease family protein [Nitrospirota bacterium]
MIYSIKLALKSLWYEKWINLLTVITIGAGLFMLGLVSLFLLNIETASRKLPERFSITVFLKTDISKDDTGRIRRYLGENSMVQGISYISKKKALEELKSTLSNSAYILEGLNENPLFPSLVIKLKRTAFDRRGVESLIKKIRSLRGVDDLVYGEELLGSINKIRSLVKFLSAALIALFFAAIIFVCYSTVKILFYRRKEEIEIFKLLGATAGFIRGPFLIEGLVIGLLGGAFGGACLFGLYFLVERFIGSEFPLLLSLNLPPVLILALPVSGVILGVFGSSIAVGKLRF